MIKPSHHHDQEATPNSAITSQLQSEHACLLCGLEREAEVLRSSVEKGWLEGDEDSSALEFQIDGSLQGRGTGRVQIRHSCS